MLPTAKALFLNGNLGMAENTADRDLLEEKFFCSIYLSNGTHKRTWAGRLNDVDKILIAAFQKLGVMPKKFMDVAVSSGVSTVMWLDSFRQAGLGPSMTATDLTMTAYLVRVKSWLHVLVDKDGVPLQYDVLGLAWRPRCRRRFSLLGNGALTVLWYFLYLKAAKRFSLMTRLKSLGTDPPTDRRLPD